jgi:DNA-binding transcriptional ArsR family regulator
VDAPRPQPPMLTNQQLVTAMEHPTRAHAVTVLNERVASAAEIGRELGKPAKHVSYHLKQLEKLGVIELVKVVETAGGRTTGRYYRALVRSWYDPDSWRQVDPAHQPGITSTILASCNADMAAAVKAGTIHRGDNHISRTPLNLDPAGYRQLVDRLDQLLPDVISLQQQAASMLGRGDETVLAKVHIIQFPSPGGSSTRPVILPKLDRPASPDLPEAQLLAALDHPTRVHALMVLNERVASASEIAREVGRSVDHVAYHLKRLRNVGAIELVKVSETPGGRIKGRYYRALVRPWLELNRWNEVSTTRQAAITSTILALCNADMAEAVRSGTIHEEDSHISRTPVIVDRATYRELVGIFNALVFEILSLQEAAAPRIGDGAELIATKVHLLLFESPDPAAA